jgi:antitoxin component YwqK of YwqJK toxin-antitoxin module
MKAHVLMSVLSLFASAIVAAQEPDLDDPKMLEVTIAKAVPMKAIRKELGLNGQAIFYRVTQRIPYTGWAKTMHGNGKVASLFEFKAGELAGPDTRWHENGQKSEELTFKDDKPDGLATKWDENGDVLNKTTFKDGKKVDPSLLPKTSR